MRVGDAQVMAALHVALGDRDVAHQRDERGSSKRALIPGARNAVA
jgi:hypothetical protein